MSDNTMAEIDQNKVFTLMQKVIEIEKKYLYNKKLQDLYSDRIKEIKELIEKGVENDVD